MHKNADIAGLISLAIFFAETNGNQNIGNARSNKYKGSFQTGVSEYQIGQRKWAEIKKSIAAFDPALIARDDKEEARVGNLDRRYNHWINVRDALMNAHADVFPAHPGDRESLPGSDRPDEVLRADPDRSDADQGGAPIGRVRQYRVSEPRIMGYLRNNSMFNYGQVDRAKTSANYREILDAMWLFNEKFERALVKFNEIKAGKKS